jgi:hypothetical protein
MHSLLFVAVDGEPFSCGFRVNKTNWCQAPPGKLHIARFETCFHPMEGHGYFGDSYLRQFIRKWKYKVIMKKKRIVEKIMTILCISKKQILNNDVLREITEFL